MKLDGFYEQTRGGISLKACVRPRSKAEIRKIAARLRKITGFEETKKFPIVQFIEWIIGDPDGEYNFEIVGLSEMDDKYAVTDLKAGIIKIREDVYKRAIEGSPRDLFTLFHEVGHFVLHPPGEVMFARGDVPAYQDPEWQANCFAAELMAPYSLARGMSAEQIVENFGMSLQAAMIRSKECAN